MTTPEPLPFIIFFFFNVQISANQDGATLEVIATSQAPHAPRGLPLSQAVQQ